MPKFDGLGTSCGRCGCWTRGTDAPRCPPFITRMEPDGARLPHITSPPQNQRAHADHMAALDRDCELENARSKVSA
jgi:hypothetical protein